MTSDYDRMTDKKSTDNEIIKALKVENQSLRTAANSLKMHYEEAQAEIERLRKEVKLVSIQFQDLQERYEEARAEIERLENENTAFGEIIKKQDDEISTLRKDLLKRQNLEERYSKSVKQFDKRLEKTVKLERAEAYKECIEKVKEKANKCFASRNGVVLEETTTYNISKISLDNLIKEMVDDDSGQSN